MIKAGRETCGCLWPCKPKVMEQPVWPHGKWRGLLITSQLCFVEVSDKQERGRLVWARTLLVSLPSTTAETSARP